MGFGIGPGCIDPPTEEPRKAMQDRSCSRHRLAFNVLLIGRKEFTRQWVVGKRVVDERRRFRIPNCMVPFQIDRPDGADLAVAGIKE